ncbi:MAG: aminoglycoside phosphotransferase family protein, partial [Candidatus Tectomicrobia bacterium]|nr:aminoglycoside phosphotransferase family protein [Candidatus Tectomicrobia bacterium]
MAPPQGEYMLPSDVYRQPHAADPILDERRVLDLVRRHGVRGAAVTDIDETGGEARAYMLDETLVLKVQRPHRLRHRTSLAKEAFFLQQLAAYPDIVVPQVLGHGQDDDIEYLVLTRMPGIPARTVTMTDAQRVTVLQQLGRTLRRLHTLPQAPFAGSPLLPGHRTRLAFVEQVETNLAQAVEVLETTATLWPFAMAPGALASQLLAELPDAIDLV